MSTLAAGIQGTQKQQLGPPEGKKPPKQLSVCWQVFVKWFLFALAIYSHQDTKVIINLPDYTRMLYIASLLAIILTLFSVWKSIVTTYFAIYSCTLLKKRNGNILWHYFIMFLSHKICPHIVHKGFLLIRMKINEVKKAMNNIIHV